MGTHVSYYINLKTKNINKDEPCYANFNNCANPELYNIFIEKEKRFYPLEEIYEYFEYLKRAGINNKWWIINSSLLLTETDNVFLKAKAQTEITWINKVKEFAEDNVVVVPWQGAEIKEENIRNLIN